MGEFTSELGDYMVHVKNIEYYRRLYYNKHRKLNEAGMWLLIFSARNYSELYKILRKILSEEDTEEFMGEMEKLNSDELILSALERRKLDQMVIDNQIEEAKEQGLSEGKRETAKKMLEKGISLDDIIDVTGLTKEELENLS